MRLVRVQDVALAGKTLPLRAPEMKALDTRAGRPDGVGVMPVHREGLAVKMGFQTLDTIAARCNPDPVMTPCLPRIPLAQRFKTFRVPRQ
jgi:hypothetical protein